MFDITEITEASESMQWWHSNNGMLLNQLIWKHQLCLLRSSTTNNLQQRVKSCEIMYIMFEDM